MWLGHDHYYRKWFVKSQEVTPPPGPSSLVPVNQIHFSNPNRNPSLYLKVPLSSNYPADLFTDTFQALPVAVRVHVPPAVALAVALALALALALCYRSRCAIALALCYRSPCLVL